MKSENPESKDIEIRKSSIHGMGVYALRAFEAGEIVLRWNLSHLIEKEEIHSLSEQERIYTHPFDEERILIVQSPERFVNHSCNNNTIAQNFCDVAIRYIAPGEEITSDYSSDNSGSKFKCACNAENCRGIVGE